MSENKEFDEFDAEKLEFYMDSTFERRLDYIFSTIAYVPSDAAIQRHAKNRSRLEIESLYNHVHLSSITSDINKQREIALELWKAWREKLNKLFPEENFCIQLIDGKHDVAVYAFREDPK